MDGLSDYRPNKNGVWKPLGASNHTGETRETDDYYATDPQAVDLLIEAGAEIPMDVWECACGGGHLARQLAWHGHDVIGTDLVQRGYGTGGVDFLQQTEVPWDKDRDYAVGILTNPPYKHADDFVLHALKLLRKGDKAFFLLRTGFLEGARRYERIFSNCPPVRMWQFSRRIQCAKNAAFEDFRQRGGSAIAYAWYEWEVGNYGTTEVRWIY